MLYYIMSTCSNPCSKILPEFPYYSHTSSMQKMVDLVFYISMVTMAKALNIQFQ